MLLIPIGTSEMEERIRTIVCIFCVIFVTVDIFYGFNKKWGFMETIGIVKVSAVILIDDLF